MTAVLNAGASLLLTTHAVGTFAIVLAASLWIELSLVYQLGVASGTPILGVCGIAFNYVQIGLCLLVIVIVLWKAFGSLHIVFAIRRRRFTAASFASLLLACSLVFSVLFQTAWYGLTIVDQAATRNIVHEEPKVGDKRHPDLEVRVRADAYANRVNEGPVDFDTGRSPPVGGDDWRLATQTADEISPLPQTAPDGRKATVMDVGALAALVFLQLGTLVLPLIIFGGSISAGPERRRRSDAAGAVMSKRPDQEPKASRPTIAEATFSPPSNNTERFKPAALQVRPAISASIAVRPRAAIRMPAELAGPLPAPLSAGARNPAAPPHRKATKARGAAVMRGCLTCGAAIELGFWIDHAAPFGSLPRSKPAFPFRARGPPQEHDPVLGALAASEVQTHLAWCGR
jgi:hypothetical protein